MPYTFFQYYGTDWAAPILTLVAIYLLGQKNKWGFIVSIVACFCWMIMGYLVESLPQILANVIFLIVNIRGFWLWKKDETL